MRISCLIPNVCYASVLIMSIQIISNCPESCKIRRQKALQINYVFTSFLHTVYSKQFFFLQIISKVRIVQSV
jgi:hypothetical protein